MAHNEHSHEHNAGHNCGDIKTELMEHFPYAVFSIALSFVGAALLDYFSFGARPDVVRHGAHVLFHAFHFLHIIFAATGAMLTYFRFSHNVVKGIVLGTLSTVFFCVLSDVFLPYFAGQFLGVSMDLHICFVSELSNVLPFLIVGLFNGWLLAQRKHLHSFYSLWSHFTHIFVSSFASLLYMISYGFNGWSSSMGIIFIVLLAAVVIPCTLSDVVVPIFFSKGDAGK